MTILILSKMTQMFWWEKESQNSAGSNYLQCHSRSLTFVFEDFSRLDELHGVFASHAIQFDLDSIGLQTANGFGDLISNVFRFFRIPVGSCVENESMHCNAGFDWLIDWFNWLIASLIQSVIDSISCSFKTSLEQIYNGAQISMWALCRGHEPHITSTPWRTDLKMLPVSPREVGHHAALKNGSVEQTFRHRWHHQVVDWSWARALSKYGHSVFVTAKTADVTLNPFQRQNLQGRVQ